MADLNTTEEFLEDGEINPDYKEPESEEGAAGEGAGEEEGEPEVPVRKSVAKYIIDRKEKTIENLKIAEQNKIIEELRAKAEGGGEEEVLASKAKDLISEEVSNRIKPVLDTIASTADEGELNELYASEPEAKALDKQIRAYMASPHYKGVPPSVVYHHLAFGNAEIIGSRKKRIADLEADHGKGAGREIRPNEKGANGVPSAEDIEGMSEEEFKKLGSRVDAGEFTN